MAAVDLLDFVRECKRLVNWHAGSLSHSLMKFT